LGSERDLAERYRTSRASVRNISAALEEAGLVYRANGRAGGILISPPEVQRVPAFLAGQGFLGGTRVLSTKITTPDDTVREALGLDHDDFVVEIQRVRFADGSPISLERAHFPAASSPGLLEQPLGGSLYETRETHYGLVTSRAEERIEAVCATSCPDKQIRPCDRLSEKSRRGHLQSHFSCHMRRGDDMRNEDAAFQMRIDRTNATQIAPAQLHASATRRLRQIKSR
jgi:UTRA domain